MRNPAAILTRGVFGPVFQREVRSSGRRLSTYWIRGGYVLALACIAAMVYFAATADMRFGSRGNAENLQQLQTFAPVLGGFYVWFQFVVMCFVASTLTAPTICDERRKGSIATLIATPLTPTQIVLGKLSGRLSQLIVLLLAGVPLLLAIRIFGGVSSWFVLSATLITLCSALMHASIALSASARVRLPSIAAGAGVVSGIGFSILPLFIALFFKTVGIRPYDEWTLAVSPYVALGFETARSLGESPGMQFWGFAWMVSCGYSLLIAAFFLLIAIYRFHRLAAMAGEASLSPEPRRQRTKKKATPTRVDGVASPRERDDEIVIRGNPVLWRELRQPLFLRWWHPWLVAAAIGAMLVLAYAQAGLSEPVPMFIAQIALTAIFLFQACVLAAGAISGERESRSLETLLTTPLTARAIVLAKWAGAVRRLYPLPLLALGIILVLGVLPGTFHAALLLHFCLIVLPPAAALTASGLWLSVITRKTAVASTLNVLLAFAFWAGVPFVIAMTLTILNAGRGFSNTGETVLGSMLIPNPGPMLVTALIGASEQGRGSRSYHTFLDFTPALFTLACFASALFFAMATALFLHLAAAALRTRTNRRA